MHRKAMAAASAAFGLFGAYLFGEMYREQHNFRVTRYEVHLGDGQKNAQLKSGAAIGRKGRCQKADSNGQRNVGKYAAEKCAAGQEKAAVQAENSPGVESAPVRIVFLSDLHNHVYGKDNAPLLQAVRDENPDLILIGGDMLTAGEKHSEPFDRALDFVGQLPEIAPVYYACGNHEQRMREYPKKYPQSFADYRLALQDKGVIFLENETACTAVGERQIILTGLEIPLYAYRKFRRVSLDADTVQDCLNKTKQGAKANTQTETKAKANTQTETETKANTQTETEAKANTQTEAKTKAKTETEAKLKKGQPPRRILLAHNPAYMYAYKNIDADLVLCGHLHGGIARLPGIGGVFSPQTFFFPKYSGEMTQEEDRTIIVSKGLGAHTIKLRLWNYPEVVSIGIN